MKEFVDSYENIPVKDGRVAIRASIHPTDQVIVSIVGDRNGLRYLSKVLNCMAEVDVENQGMPDGERAHIPR